ncbi:MAG TPA: hypothetical protein VIV40_39860, partial [Kofleriaceae bacterium]
MRAHVVAFVAALSFAGCGGSGDDHHDDATATLTIEPATSELLIDNGVKPTEDFTATLTYPDGFTKDVTSDVHFSVDSGYALFSANTLTAQSAGKTQVLASYSDKSALAQVIIRLRNTRVDPTLPPGAGDWFTNNPEDPTRAPTVVYPPAGVVMPRNLGDFEIHWT